MAKSKYMSFEAMRRDRPHEPDHQIGRVVRVNKIKNAVDVTIGGALDSVADNVPLVASESALNVNVGDDVALARFSGSWVVVGVVGKGRRTTSKFHSLETIRSLKSYGDLMVHGQSYEYGNSYHHGNSYFYGDAYFIGDVYGISGDYSGWAGLEDNAGNPINPDVDNRIQVTDDGVINADVDGTGKILQLSIAQGQISHDSIADVSTDDHHAQSHVIADTTGLGTDHTTSGLTAGYVLRASGATTAAFAQLSHADLASVTSDQHHAQNHVLATNTALGSTHTISGTSSGQVLRASSSSAANFQQLAHTDLGSVTSDQHHAQSHVLANTSGLGSTHTTSGLTAGQVLRATGATTAAFQALQASDLAAHVLATTSGLGSQHTTSGLTTGYVLRASGATTAAFAQLAHSDLGTVTSDQHHAQNHVLATNTALGATHTISGTSAGQVLRASSSSAANFQQLAHTDLGTVTSDQHHAQNHVLASTSGLGATHTVSGLTAGQFLRATGATTAAFQTVQSGDLPTHASTHLPSGGDALTTAAPGADSVNVAASGTGSANSLARSDHTHNLDEAIAPTWTGKHTFTNATAIEIDVATGDPVIIFDTQAADKFIMGVDDSVTGDPFVISSGGALGTNNVMSIASTGEIELSADSSIIWDERAAPSTPGSSKWKTYFKTDGMYYMDDAGVETGPLAESAAPAESGASEVLAWIGWWG